MARRKPALPDGPDLYELQERTERRRLRRQRALFIPRILEDAALGDFPKARTPAVVIELNGGNTAGEYEQIAINN